MIKELSQAKQYKYKGRPKTNHDNITKLEETKCSRKDHEQHDDINKIVFCNLNQLWT